ncbi:PEGA domain-containing protein [Archangium lansingense]|uniref:PEGA domain-containing protein n=1 Tax=Archangium lansingense TaxID=2995310 RepID=A0ABT4AIX9_9BACT|nr:PEGA domain-containing protein [Archangium lansinium]MCY1080812.1 PEGA domain-containing protein [Archangium lansinium]
MKQKTWIVVILLGALAINALAYMVVRNRRAPASVEAPPRAAVDGTASAAPPPPAPTTPAAPVPSPEEEANAGLARARRAAGLAALEDRDYNKAVAEFTEALSLRKDKGDLVELLRIASDLQSRDQVRTQNEPAKPEREPEPAARPAPKAKPVRVATRARPAKEEPPAVPETARNGLLLVTSTPPGLVVMVNGKAVDLTPARLPLRAGTHRVALAQGERRLFEDSVEIEADEVRSINRDLTAELAPPPSAPVRTQPEPTIVPAVATTAQTPAAAPGSTVTASTKVEPRPEPAAPATTARPTAGGKGNLDITSPSIYGEVWVNNRPYGFPPVTARDLPAGQARVEIRVNGAVKRRMNIEVEPGRSTSVRVR